MVERVTYMRMYVGLSPTSIDHREEFILASSCSLSDVKQVNIKKEKKEKKSSSCVCARVNGPSYMKLQMSNGILLECIVNAIFLKSI